MEIICVTTPFYEGGHLYKSSVTTLMFYHDDSRIHCMCAICKNKKER